MPCQHDGSFSSALSTLRHITPQPALVLAIAWVKSQLGLASAMLAHYDTPGNSQLWQMQLLCVSLDVHHNTTRTRDHNASIRRGPYLLCNIWQSHSVQGPEETAFYTAQMPKCDNTFLDLDLI